MQTEYSVGLLPRLLVVQSLNFNTAPRSDCQLGLWLVSMVTGLLRGDHLRAQV